MACFHVFLSFSFLSERNRFLAVRGKRSVCARLLSVCCAFSFRKWADLQSAEGHIDSVHACDDVKVKGRGMALIKSRAAAAQWKRRWKGRANWVQARAHSSIVSNVCWLQLDNAQGRPFPSALSLWVPRCGSWKGTLSGFCWITQAQNGKEVNTLLLLTEWTIPHCFITTHRPTHRSQSS